MDTIQEIYTCDYIDHFPLLFVDKTPEENLEILNNCNCCRIHKLNKPKKIQKLVDLQKNHQTIEFSNRDENNNIKCSCDCRHRARFICRKYA